MILGRALALLLVLLPSVALAQGATFDLSALRAKWPGANAVLLERHLVFSMPDPQTLRVRAERRLAILDDSVQEDLVLFTASRRPGCRDPHDLSIRVTDRAGVVQPWDAELLELVAGDHPVDAEKSSVTVSASRRGLSAGALLEESWSVDYAAGCFDGFIGTERYFVEPDWPVEHALVEIACAGQGCWVEPDNPGSLAFTPREGGGLQVEAWDVAPAVPEFSAPAQRLPAIIVTTSPDPLVLGRLLAEKLAEQVERAGAVADSHRDLAEQAWAHVKPRSVRYARYLDESVPRLPDQQAFWQFGFDWGGPVAAGRRPLLPLEWWALSLAILGPHGGVPVVLDLETHLDPPAIGRVVSYDRIGVLLPGRGLLTDGGWFGFAPLEDGGESNALLAGMWLLDVDGLELKRLPAGADLEARTWTATATPSTGDKLLVDVTRSYAGERGGRLRMAFEDRVAEWREEHPARRDSEDRRDREFAVAWLFGHSVGRTEVTVRADDPGFFALATSFSRPGLVQRGDGLVAVSLPIIVHEDLSHLVGPAAGEQRVSDFSFSLARDRIDLEVQAPAGYRLVDVPETRSLQAGPVSLEVRWEREGKGAALSYNLAVRERIVGAQHTPELEQIAEELRRLLRTRLLFVPE